jgi:RNA polymerase sigma factor (sigma-70 family)
MNPRREGPVLKTTSPRGANWTPLYSGQAGLRSIGGHGLGRCENILVAISLKTFFLRRIRAKADAADLAQEVYVRMLRISDQDAIRNPVHYLYTVANNLVKEHAVLDRRQASAIDIDDAPAHEQLETLPEFDGELDARQRVARLGVVLKQLRPKCRAAVELRFTQGLSFREIAMHLGVSPQMAKKYVAQGLSHCRRRMARLG